MKTRIFPVFGVAGADCVDEDGNIVYDEITYALSNVVIDLDPPEHDFLKATGCDEDHDVAPGQEVVYLFDASVSTDLFEYVLRGPDGTEIPSDATWTGSYMVSITPMPALTPSSDPNDFHTIELRSVVFRDGYRLAARRGAFFNCAHASKRGRSSLLADRSCAPVTTTL